MEYGKLKRRNKRDTMNEKLLKLYARAKAQEMMDKLTKERK